MPLHVFSALARVAATVPYLRVPCFVQPRDFLLLAITTRAPLLLTG